MKLRVNGNILTEEKFEEKKQIFIGKKVGLLRPKNVKVGKKRVFIKNANKLTNYVSIGRSTTTQSNARPSSDEQYDEAKFHANGSLYGKESDTKTDNGFRCHKWQ